MNGRDEDLVACVTEELSLDPKLDAGAIAVSAQNGMVTLRGTVATFREKREAEKDVKRVQGVELVDNELEVRPLLNEAVREDADLRGDVLQALMLDSLIPRTIDAAVRGGCVTLTGTADWQYQRDEAELVASNIAGALHVVDEIALRPMPNAGDVKDAIGRAFGRSARLDARRLSVTTAKSTVTVKGKVGSWAEHDEALAAAWSVPGVTRVEDRITVQY